MTRDVFISYSTRDQATATTLCTQLEAAGIHCWIAPRDMDIGGQTGYGASIIEAISKSSMMVVILSQHSNASVQVMREVERAVAKGMPILPFQIEAFELSPDLEFFLSATHRQDASKGPISQHIGVLIQRVVQLRRANNPALPHTLPARQPKPGGLRRHWPVLAGSALLLAIVTWIVLQQNGKGGSAVKSSGPPSGERGSIAVLPFVNMSDDKANEYFSDGITEETLNAIAKLPGLRVASRTSSFSFKGHNLPVDSIAQRLRVAHVLEGSVRKSGQRVKITAQLIDARTDAHVWSEVYDRDLKDVFAVQTEIARAIAHALELEFGAATNNDAPTTSERAHDNYLLGLNEFNRRTRGSLQAAIGHFESAIREDSAYAHAWAGLAMAHATRPLFDQRVNSLESARLARAAAKRALELDSTLALPHAAIGWAAGRIEWKWQEAEAELRRAVQMGPNDVVSKAWLGHVLLPLGRIDEALDLVNAAGRLDPVSAYSRQTVGIVLYHAGRKDESAAQLRLARTWEPDNPTVLNYLSRLHLARGEYDSAQVVMRRNAQLSGFNRLDEIDSFVQALRDKDLASASRLLGAFERAFSDYQLAIFYLMAQDREGAIRMLQRSLLKHEPSMSTLAVDVDLNVLHNDPRVTAILKQVGFRN
jgi:TolB-like protein